MRRCAMAVVFSGVVLLGGVLASVVAMPAGATAPTSAPPVVATNWTLGTIPSPTTAADVQLSGSACATSSFCIAVGTQPGPGGSGTNDTLIEQWNGSSWSIVPSPNPTGAGRSELDGVSCAGPSFCVAVGISGPGGTLVDPLAEQWNGTVWSVASAANPTTSVQTGLNAVSCLSPTSCSAVGYSSTPSFEQLTLAETWNGTVWAVSPTTPPAGATSSELNSISCTTSSSCMAVGRWENASSDFVSLAQVWNGSGWTVVTTPNPGAGTSGQFEGVSCAGANFCVAVGEWYTGSDWQAQLATWNGTSWTNTTAPEADASVDNFLGGVACISATSCSASGNAGDPNLSPVALSWNGTSWSIVPAPGPSGSTGTEAVSISCITNWECVAVGTSTLGGNTQPYVVSAPIARSGYRFVASDGGVFSYGAGAPFLGSMGGTPLNKPVVGMAVMPAGDGYDLVASDGGVFSFGSAKFYGSTGGIHLNAPVVGMALTADGAGYWLVASDGGIFTYGDAQFYGSAGSIKLNKPIVGMAATPDGKGYWLVASDGGIFSYGDAAFLGSAGSLVLNKPVVGIAAPVAGGYYLVASDGGIFNYPTTGGPPFEGSTGSMTLNKPIVGMTSVAGGYYLSGSDGGVFTYPTTNGPTFYGSTGSITLNAPIVGISG
jgi:hypothetical protein